MSFFSNNLAASNAQDKKLNKDDGRRITMQSGVSKSAFKWNPDNQALEPELDHPAPFE